MKTIAKLIETLAPEPYEVLKPFFVTLQPCEGEYIATWLDTNISASGKTEKDAVCNFKDILVATFECLTKHKLSQLGPSPTRQLTVLHEFIRKTTPIKMKRVEKYGVEVWSDEEMDALRKERCLCLNCNWIGTDGCATVGILYAVCKGHNVALAVTRCPTWERKRKELDANAPKVRIRRKGKVTWEPEDKNNA